MPSSQAQGSTVAVSATGESFLAFYTGPRLNPDAVVAGSTGRLAYNTIWYTARLAWYAFPWSLIAFGAFAVALRRYVRQRFHLRVTLRRSAEALSASAPTDPARPRRRSESGVGAEVNPADGSERRSAESGLLFAVVASFVLIVLFSFSDRKADRLSFRRTISWPPPAPSRQSGVGPRCPALSIGSTARGCPPRAGCRSSRSGSSRDRTCRSSRSGGRDPGGRDEFL